MEILTGFLYKLGQGESSGRSESDIDAIHVDRMKPLPPFILINKDGAALPEFKAALARTVRKIISKIASLLASRSPSDLVLNRHKCVFCVKQPQRESFSDPLAQNRWDVAKATPEYDDQGMIEW